MYNHAVITDQPYLGMRQTLGYALFLGAHSYLRPSSMHLSGIENCSPNGLFGTLKAKKLFMSQRVGPFCHLTWAISTQLLLYADVLYRVIDYKLSISYIEKLQKRI